ncbi:MAG: hypothetical protein M1827_001553 [Pycnora praestabilis]|nr:MAG: hypothetical protein M1827_001553 [Pycnora praestabilis]
MAGNQDEDPLAYGDFDSSSEGTERGIIGDTFRRLRDRYSQPPVPQYSAGAAPTSYPQLQDSSLYHSYPNTSGTSQSQQYQQNRPPQPPESTRYHLGSFQTSQSMSSIFDKFHEVVQGIGSEINQALSGQGPIHSHTHSGAECEHGLHDHTKHRYNSFAAQREGNDIKWHVDGCSYMWAVSRALENASESIWILDWWLSPELYLRRPPSKNEQYRLDRMLLAAAQRGAKVNIIVYKEVTQALTRKYLSPALPDYLHSLLPRSTDAVTSALSRLGLAMTFASLEAVEAENPLMEPPLTVSSSHTKHALEELHPNISVFRHPDHLPDAQTLQSSFLSSLQNLSLTAATASKLPGDALKAIYGMNEDVILYWAHHEKLLLVDGQTAFMGGLDLCFGRWDTNQHPIADLHPGNLNQIIFPGQDYNNARIMDFQDVANYQNNKLDRVTSSRMGWSDLSMSLRGPVVEDLRAHFVERWNFIYNEKYDVREDTRYSRLTFTENAAGVIPQPSAGGSSQRLSQQSYGQPSQASAEDIRSAPSQQQGQYYPPPPQQSHGTDDGVGQETQNQPYGLPEGRHQLHRVGNEGGITDKIRDRAMESVQYVQDQYFSGNEHHSRIHGHRQGSVPCQIVRSCTKWSAGIPTEHSIANAYISVIQNSQHFIYIENQFFITATSDAQKPVQNKIGAAIVDRILQAARSGEKYKVIVVMPAVPGFAGDLRDDSSLGTRAIMKYQYDSINRGGHSIMESVAKQGYDPTEYIRFYNLRNYDRINASAALREAQEKSGITYDDARRQHDDKVGAGYDPKGEGTGAAQTGRDGQYQHFQHGAGQIKDRQGLGSGRWDSVSECYMLGGEDIRNVPWENGELAEMDAFVSEILYIHTKLLIADDTIVICGSANFNDRSQLGTHDSEICVVVEDPTPVDSYMNGQPWRASKFAATLRRQLFRKHLGLLPPQDMERPDQNYEPIGVPNVYDFGSREDQAVVDPLSENFLNLWNSRAKQNTDAFGRAFHPVPHDSVKTWQDYDKFYEHFFHEADAEAEGKEGRKMPSKYQWGHVVAEEFSPGDQGVKELKDLLSTVKGTLVEMPLLFLIDAKLAEEGVTLNAFTEEVYT